MYRTGIGGEVTRVLARICALALCTTSALVAVARAEPAPADRALFVRYGCYQCHGYEGQGGEALRIAPSPYPFDAFALKVRKPVNEMPAYAPEVLSDADLQALYRYVRAIPEPPADLPLR
jgi:ubiquinol-cytochrome c reductase cytochrome c subunit